MRGTLRVLAAIGVAASLLATAVGAGAEGAAEPRVSPVLGPDFLISGANTTPSEDNSIVAWNQTANEYLVVWEDDRNLSTRGWDIYGRRVRANGIPVGTDFRISGPNATGGEHDPAVVWNQTANEYLVVWGDDRTPTRRCIYGQRVSAAGVGIGSDFLISGPDASGNPAVGGWENSPAVAWNQTANEYLVDDRDWSTRGWDLFGRRVRANGTPVRANFRISGPNAIKHEGNPVVAWNEADNEYLVVWEDGRNASTRGSDIYGRRVDADGARLGGDFRISGPKATWDDFNPVVAWNRTANEYLLVWTDTRNASTRGADIYGRRVRASGARIGGDFRISGPNAIFDDMSAAVAWNRTANEYLVVWTDQRDFHTRGSDIYGRLLDAGGATMGGDFRINGANTQIGAWSPAVAWNRTANEYLVVWSFCRTSGCGYDIYGRRVAG
jgi:hypothetical protein